MLLSGEVVRSRYATHSRLHILSPMEARLHHADLTILGGLNEGSWPSETDVDPWMSRPMRAMFGLPDVTRRVGLAAHDFAMQFCAPEVVMTRSQKSEGSPTVASRWLLRLDILLQAIAPGCGLDPSEPWRAWVRHVDQPESFTQFSPPTPRPPVAARPRKLSATRIEQWFA